MDLYQQGNYRDPERRGSVRRNQLGVRSHQLGLALICVYVFVTVPVVYLLGQTFEQTDGRTTRLRKQRNEKSGRRNKLPELVSVLPRTTLHRTHEHTPQITDKPVREKIQPGQRRQPRRVRRITHENRRGFPIVEDDIFWSKELDSALPKGYTEEEANAWMDRTRKSQVTSMHRATWRTCGQGKNKYLRLMDGSTACARYRHPFTRQIQGELYSYYLARLLGIDHAPPVVLAVVNSTAPMWAYVGNTLPQMKWEEGILVVLIRWIDALQRGKMPAVVLDGEVSGQDRRLAAMGKPQLLELVQWSDLIIFDYITANSDRVASNQDAADLNKDPSQMKKHIHNLQKSTRDGAIWLIDNESGLIDAYMLLKDKRNGGRFTQFHRFMLERMCLFRRSTVRHVEELYSLGEGAAEFLLRTVAKNEPLTRLLPTVRPNIHFQKTMADRIADVYNRIRHCMLAHMSPMD